MSLFIGFNYNLLKNNPDRLISLTRLRGGLKKKYIDPHSSGNLTRL